MRNKVKMKETLRMQTTLPRGLDEEIERKVTLRRTSRSVESHGMKEALRKSW